MRKLILDRIEEIRKKENGFSYEVEKWRSFSHGIKHCHISKINFSLLNDTELVFLFERLIRRYNQ